MSLTRRHFLAQLSCGAAAARCLADTHSHAAALPRYASPEEAGIASSNLVAFLDEMEATQHELHSFMMLRHGKVAAEGWWDPYGPQYRHSMYSMSKSFTATAIGFCVTEGRLTVEDKVLSFFPDDVPDKVSEHLASLKVKHLLTMSVGSKAEPTGACVKTDNWVRTFLAHEIDKAPGTTFLYNSAATYMLSAIVQKVTGQRVIDYLETRLFQPLGIIDKTWETCPKGINTGGWGLSIPTEAMAKFGQLFLQKGRWGSRQIIPSAWIEEASTFKIQQPPKPGSKRPKEQDDWQQGYCYQMWRCQHQAFRGDGAFGQFTIVLPEHDAVIVMTSETKDLQGQLDLVWKHLLPAFHAVAPTASEANTLKRRLETAKLLVPGNVEPNAERSIQRKPFVFDSNELGFTSVEFSGTDQLEVVFKAGTARHRLVCGQGSNSDGTWVRGETGLPGTPPRLIAGNTGANTTKVASHAAWTTANTLLVTLRYYETPHHDEITFQFDGGDQVRVSFLNSIAKLGGAKKDSRPVLKGKA